jgi:protein-disulfide isomerase/uncharacterized membrane protein
VLKIPKSERELRWVVWGVLLLSAIGFVVSVMALDQHVRYTHGFASGPSFCNISAYYNCEAVNASEWSTLLGIPVASYGMFFYLLLIGGAFAVVLTGSLASAAFMHFVLLMSMLSVLGSIGLFLLSSLVIKALCIMCIVLYVTNFALFLLAWRGGFSGRLLTGLVASVRAVGSVVFAAISGEGFAERWVARVVILGTALLAYWNIKAPDVLLYRLSQKAQKQDSEQVNPVPAWLAEPVVAIPLKINEGAFGDYSEGEVDAPIKIVEFADYECGGCRLLAGKIHEVLEKHKGRYLFVFKNYPLDNRCNKSVPRPFHQYACLAAHLARCGGEQGKFWELNQFLFTAEELEGQLPTDNVRNLLVSRASAQFGLDKEALKECVQSQRYALSIQRDVEAADVLGLDGTPSVWINGKKVVMPSAESIERIIEHILASPQ